MLIYAVFTYHKTELFTRKHILSLHLCALVILCFLVWCFLLSVSIHVVLVSIGYFLCLVLALLSVCPFPVSWLLSPIFHFSPAWHSYSGLSTFTVVFLSFVMISLYLCVQSFPFRFWDFKFQFSLPLEHFLYQQIKAHFEIILDFLMSAFDPQYDTYWRYYQMYNKCIIVLFVLKNVLTTFGFKGNNNYMKPSCSLTEL